MNTQLKRWLWFFGVLGVGIAAPLTYLLTLGHYYLPFESFDYRNETIEVREYDGLYWRFYTEKTRQTRVGAAILRVSDKVFYPGRVRMDAEIVKVGPSFELSGPNSSLQKTLQAMGYGFPPECTAGVESNNTYRISLALGA